MGGVKRSLFVENAILVFLIAQAQRLVQFPHEIVGQIAICPCGMRKRGQMW
jgi:hypothetical protein